MQSNEVLLFMDDMGFPIDGIGKRIVFEGLSTTKKNLKTKINTMSQPEFDKRLSTIVAKNRKKEIHEIRFCQYLRYQEVVSFLLGIGESLALKENIKIKSTQ
ncbi:hypothetical protein [Muricauda sp. MAR_2010_75]|uniref:hypothetical protein n=1 Tax=Allomuricauda sp. MAR_2010_75 TaxID=1250232 RepID=UPI0012E09DDF|nr:hypothetical protein [Muricauda sp. MAR_2010_75]